MPFGQRTVVGIEPLIGNLTLDMIDSSRAWIAFPILLATVVSIQTISPRRFQLASWKWTRMNEQWRSWRSRPSFMKNACVIRSTWISFEFQETRWRSGESKRSSETFVATFESSFEWRKVSKEPNQKVQKLVFEVGINSTLDIATALIRTVECCSFQRSRVVQGVASWKRAQEVESFSWPTLRNENLKWSASIRNGPTFEMPIRDPSRICGILETFVRRQPNPRF